MGLDQYILIKRDVNSELEIFERFRKVNCLQGYFENNFNVDNCQELELSKDIVCDIINLTQQVLDNPEKGEKLFPTQMGFFYGSDEYDACYFDDVKITNDAFTRLLSVFDTFESVYYYCWY